MAKYLDYDALLYFMQKLKTIFVTQVSGKGLSTNDFTAALKAKLDGIATGANNYTHPAHTAKNAGLYKTTVDSQGHVSAATAVEKADITALGIPAQDTTYAAVTTSANGLMAATDKAKLDGIAQNANNYALPTAGTALGGVKTTSSVSNASGYTPVPVINGIPYYKDTTYNAATSAANGLMAAADKSKLDAFGVAGSYALKSDITNMYKYKGSVAAVANLPTTGNATGDVYNVEASGMNYAWNGTAWDALGEIFTIESITNAEIDAITA